MKHSAGWWFGSFFIFPYIGNVIIPFAFHIFHRGRYTVYHQPDCVSCSFFAAFVSFQAPKMFAKPHPLMAPMIMSTIFWSRMVLSTLHDSNPRRVLLMMSSWFLIYWRSLRQRNPLLWWWKFPWFWWWYSHTCHRSQWTVLQRAKVRSFEPFEILCLIGYKRNLYYLNLPNLLDIYIYTYSYIYIFMISHMNGNAFSTN